MAKIFLSHSHADDKLAHVLADQIRKELELLEEDVFVSSEPPAIPEGDWISQLQDALKTSKIFIPLITPSSDKSVWVAFEYGNFWERRKGKFIFPLLHPKADISTSPLNMRQCKLVTDAGHLNEFFKVVCRYFRRVYKEKADLDVIIQSALKMPTITSADRQFQMICKLQLITATSLDVKDSILRWMKDQDILHDAQLVGMDLSGVHFTSAKMQRSNFGGAILRGADFWDANLENAILGSAKLQGANFQNVKSLLGASFQGAELDQTTTLPDGTKYKPELGLVQLTRFDAVIDR